jgi:hypothetical protein
MMLRHSNEHLWLQIHIPSISKMLGMTMQDLLGLVPVPIEEVDQGFLFLDGEG